MNGLKNVRHRRTDALTQVRWDELESLLAAYYREHGYAVNHCGTGATNTRFDGGIDLKLRKDDAYILVQCKHWNAKQVPHNAVHELMGLMVSEGATGAILVTSGEFTRAAIEAATRQGHVQLVDGDDLRGMLGPLPVAAQPTPGTAWSQSGSLARRAATTVGERLLSAAEDRIRYGSHRKGRKGAAAMTARSALILLLVKVVFALVIFLILTLTLQSAIQTIMSPLTSATATPLVHAQDPVPVPAADADGGVLRRGAGSGQRELIDHYSGTTIQEPAGVPAYRQPMAAEVRESQRRADEAARIIEASTPEM